MDEQQMQDKTVSLTLVSSWALWAAAVVLVLLAFFTSVESGDMGVVCAIGAATLAVRGYFVDLAARERKAFQLGRNSVGRQ